MKGNKVRFIGVSVLAIMLLTSVQWLGMPGFFSPATAHAAGFIDFENGQDRAPIKSTIPGLQFTTTDGQDWLYGDWRSGTYNGKYPNGSYYSDGNFFAWLGEAQGNGRIDFTEGTGTFLSVDVSTLDSVDLTGYDTAGKEIAKSSFTGGNLNTGHMNKIELRAPAGVAMKYVIVSGQANYWLIDNLSTDATGVPGNPTPQPTPPTGPTPEPQPGKRQSQPAMITVVQRPDPNLVSTRSTVDFGIASATMPPSVPDDGIVNYEIEVVNRGRGSSSNTIIHMPFDTNNVRLLDATFSNEKARVSQIITSTTPAVLEIYTGALGSDEVVTGTVRLLTRPGIADGTPLGQRLSYTWKDARSGGEGTSNLPILVAGAADNNQSYYPLDMHADGANVGFGSAAFKPGELVSYWYNAPDGTVVPVGSATADLGGGIGFVVDTTGWPSGNYSMVAMGNWSQITAVTAFSVATSN